jgi:hypothetical protein
MMIAPQKTAALPFSSAIKRPVELQIQIDDVYACPGSCGGCVLAAEERRATAPDMASEILDLCFDRLARYIPTLDGLRYINITFGIADHLRMPDAYLQSLYHRSADLLEQSGFTGPDNAIFFTTSLIGKTENILPRLEALLNNRRKVPIYPIAVLDPAKLYNKNFGAIYEGNILQTKKLFGKVDLAINLSDEAIQRITPRDLHDFAADHGFGEVTLNWTPTPGNLDRTFGDLPALAQWLFDFDDCVDQSGRILSSLSPMLRRSVEMVYCSARTPDHLPSMIDVLTEILPNTVRRSLEIDHHGFLLPKLEAVGDITHGSRFDLPPLGHLRDGEMADLIDRALPGLTTRIARLHSQHKACMQCPHLAICAITGFHVYNHVARDRPPSNTACPHIGAALIARYRDQVDTNDPAALIHA